MHSLVFDFAEQAQFIDIEIGPGHREPF